MFHTFQSSVGMQQGAEGDANSNKPARATGSRRISTSNACVECRRRKIRCDGTQPCGQCQWYQHPEACGYSKPAQRVVPSRKLVDKLSNNIEQYRAILNKLYPTKDIDTLLTMQREDLLELALSIPATASTTSPSTGPTQSISEIAHGSDGTDSLEALEQAPAEDPYWDEARKHLVRVQGISDDVNGLSMSVDRLSSYVGISSITAALKVIVRCAPQAKPLIAHNTQETALPSRAGSPPPELADNDPLALPSPAQGQELIKSYFERVHLFFPMIDERKFWSTYFHGDRKDSPWLALLNIVFAMGSLASSTADNEVHYVYFNRSRRHLSLESFGSGNLEVLQALAIMSGYYMHYLNRPNEANSLMGGTLRMATALGLHREYSDKNDANRHLNVSVPEEADSISPEMRRRIWWSLFCLDTWASTTTGRPSLGRMGPSITVLPPGQVTNPAHVLPPPNTPQYIEQLKILPLIHASEFCKIATRIQDRLVESPLLTPSETAAYDGELVKWHEELPTILHSMTEPCPEFLRRVRFVMKWRFQNIRIILHRPVLLSTALRRCTFASLSADERVAVQKCRLFAAKTIEEICSDCLPDLISGWNAVWFVFQACMVPLVSLFSDQSMPEEAERWRTTLEVALTFLERSKPWSISAKRSLEAVTKLYAAYKVQFPQHQQQHPSHQHQQQTHQPHAHHHHYPPSHPHHPHNHPISPLDSTTFDYTSVPDVGALSMNPGAVGGPWGPDSVPGTTMAHLSNFWDDMMWDTNLPDMLEAPFGLGDGYEYHGQGQAQESGALGWMQGN